MSTSQDHGIEIEHGVWLPANGQDVYYFPEPHLKGGPADRIMRITSSSGKIWYAATSAARYSVNPDVFVMPGGRWLFVRGVVVDSENPRRWEKVPVDRVEECMISPDGRIAVMHGLRAAAGYSQFGLHWLVRLDHLFGIKFTAIDNRRVYLTATVDEDIVAQCPIALSLWSGEMLFD